ncbi:MAG TPA: protein kinase, partial [Polyangiaceae bacterium]
MTATIDILRGELERLFSLEEMTGMSRTLLGLDPEEVGGVTAKGSFARALTERCVDGDRIEALVDVILVSRNEVDPRVRDIAALLGSDDLPAGAKLGDFTIDRKVASSDLGVQYAAKKDGRAYTLKTLRREAARDKRAVHRFLTANRLVGTVQSEGLPKNLEAGEAGEGVYYVAYEYLDATPLSARLARTGPTHINELKTLLRGILEPLAALHKAQLTHGDLKLDHVLLTRAAGAAAFGGAGATQFLSGPLNDVRVVLIDLGGDRLRPRLAHADKQNGGFGFLAVYGSPRTIAPEQVRGRPSDARTDVYAFGSMLYELLSGKPVFQAEAPADAAFSHLAVKPEAPSTKAPRGWITKEVDDWVLSMLDKNPASRPKDAGALLDQLDRLGRTAKTQPGAQIAPEKLEALLDMLTAAPDDSETAIALEKAVDEGADATRIAKAFAEAAANLHVADEDGQETKKALLYRAARIFDGAEAKEDAERVYAEISELDPSDEIATIALEEVRRSLGKYEEIVETLLARTENAEPGAARARILSEIGRLYASELDDAEQALVAYAQAICELPGDEEYASEVERLAGSKPARWNEVLTTMTEAVKGEAVSVSDRAALLDRIARWYESKLGRADLALMAYQQVLAADPASETALDGLTTIYRRAQQWPELAQVLIKRADAAGTTPRSRDLRTEAAELFELRLNDAGRAQKTYEQVLEEDPGHVKAGDALARLVEKSGDFQRLASLYEARMQARRGEERADALVKLAEVYEDHLDDLAKATQKFEELLATDPANLNGLKGLDRIYNRTGRYRELLDVLARQVAAAATPRQKINLYERIASLHDEEFLDHAKAAEAREAILDLDPANDASLTALARHYRALSRWEDLVRLYEKHAETTGDEARRVELYVQRARVLAEQIGSPERATRAYDQILELSPGHAGALEALARLRELSGDAHAALSAIEALAAKATTPEGKSEQWVRAAKLLEARGDRDGAIERYKLALEANRKDASAAAALRDAFAQRGDHASVIGLIEREL